MILNIELNVIKIVTEYSISIVKINEIQAIELVNKGNDDGGILTITLKGDKSEQIVYGDDDINTWNAAKEWLDNNILELSKTMSNQDILTHIDTHPGF